ncbi:hypothetical protein IQ06DRAFT_375224 [Phaeosphaeriaceae sp. SRC1lsM3a]|nr:hypothetical protein IQ06DRAFT_375224 [Stagonospora sp. SRC1lsM3a]
MSEEVLRSIEELSESESSNPIEEEVSKVAEILGTTKEHTKLARSNTLILKHPTRFLHHEPSTRRPRTLIVLSRESGGGGNMHLLLMQNVAWALRYVNSIPAIPIHRIIVTHQQQFSSTSSIPHQAYGATAPQWAPFLNAVAAITPQEPDVDLLVRGWDGGSTHNEGFKRFVERFGSGNQCNGHLNITFVFFQMRDATHADIQALFGSDVFAPGVDQRWWPPAPPQALAAHALEAGMGVRVHPPFSHQAYLHALTISNVHRTIAQSRYNNSTICLLYVLDCIDAIKVAGGGPLPGQNQNHPLFNLGRNRVPWQP